MRIHGHRQLLRWLSCAHSLRLVRLARGLAKAAAGIQHLNVAENLIGDYGLTDSFNHLRVIQQYTI